MKQETLNKIKNYFAQNKAVKLVYLYGSQAKGRQRPDSDIDLAILVDEKKGDSFDIRLNSMNDLSSSLSEEIEVQDLNTSPITFAYRVIQEGKIIYQKSEKERLKFELKVMQRYFDLLPFLAEYSKRLAYLARKGKIDARPFTD